MTDRELLELAAKAAGIEGAWGDNEHPGGEGIWDWCSCWNPLYSDEHALRLAVKLRMTIITLSDSIEVSDYNSKVCCQEMTCDGEDPYAATRRAIVRAAAEIGKESK